MTKRIFGGEFELTAIRRPTAGETAHVAASASESQVLPHFPG